MARKWSCGFELQNKTIEVEGPGSAASTIDTTLKRSGLASMKCKLTSASTTKNTHWLYPSDDFRDMYARVYINITTTPSALCTILMISDDAASTNFRIRLATDNTLEVWNATTKIGSSSSALNNGTWYRVELRYNNVSGAANDTIEGLLDGSSFASSTTSVGDSAGINSVSWGLMSTCTGEINFDDIAVNDSTGGSQNSYPGAGSIIHLQPNAAGDSNQWLKTDASAGDSNNYTLVDETTPNDATDLVESVTLNDVDFYNCGASGIGASDTVNVVQVGARFNNEVADATTEFKLQIEKTSGGTVSQSAGIIPNSTTWNTNAPVYPFIYPITLYADPDSAAWTQTTLDSMQIGVKLTTAGTNKIQVSTVWALVEYVPAAGGGGQTDWPKFQNRGFWSWDFS